MQFRMFGTCLFYISLIVSHVSAQTSLTGTWRASDDFSYAIEDKYSITSGANGLNQSLKLDTDWHVKTVAIDGSAVITVTIKRVQFKANQKGVPLPFEELSFDSDNPVEPRDKGEMNTFNALNAFVGSQISIAINEKRELSEFELSEPLATHMEKNQIMRELAGVFGHTFTTNGMRRRITNWLIPSPSKPVSKGETWQQEQSSRYEDLYVCVSTYTMEGSSVRDGQTLTKISVKTELALPANDKGRRQAKIAEQSGGGVVYFDEKAGRVTEATLLHQIADESPFSSGSISTTINAKLISNPRK